MRGMEWNGWVEWVGGMDGWNGPGYRDGRRNAPRRARVVDGFVSFTARVRCVPTTDGRRESPAFGGTRGTGTRAREVVERAGSRALRGASETRGRRDAETATEGRVINKKNKGNNFHRSIRRDVG